MINGIIGVLIILLLIGVVVSIVSFLWEHKGLTLTLIAGIAVIVYCRNSDTPFSFLFEGGNNIKEFFWRIIYRNTVFDSIWIFALVLLLCYVTANIILRNIPRDIIRMIICTGFTGTIILINLLDISNSLRMILLLENLAGISVLWLYRAESLKKIGSVKDVKNAFNLIEKSVLQMALLNLLTVAGFFYVPNQFFDIDIPDDEIVFVILFIYLIWEIKCYYRSFKGYKYIKQYVKNQGFFSYTDIREDKALAYLIDAREYSASVIDILTRRKKIYKLSMENDWYLNQTLEKNFEKCIKNNLSSEEIREKINVDFKEIGFENIYKMMFSIVKGYEINFVESEDAKSRRKTEVGLGAIEFVLMRYPIEKHPLLSEPESVRASYIGALDILVRRGDIDQAKWDTKIEEYRKVFNVHGKLPSGEESIRLFAEVISRKVNFFKTVKNDYSYILLLEAIYFENLLTEEAIEYQEIETTFEQLKIKRNHRDFIYQYIKSMFIEGNITVAEILLESKVKKNVRRVMEYIHHNIMWNEKYVVSKQYQVAVCATMSAGKSTFINSLLGMDYIPAKNEACTAKITTIRDNDNIEKLIGCYTRNDGTKVYSNIIDAEILNAWNEDIEVKETILEGDIEEVRCENGVLVVHDTPGTNNSGDDAHHDRTIEFLKNRELDLIIYLINAEYISTNDTEVLVKEIQEITKDRKTKIIFGINKVDSFDEEAGDDIQSAIDGVKAQLTSYGFSEPVIFPFSANAARLFKLVIKGKELTKRERRAFDNLFELFQKLNCADYVVNTSTKNESQDYPKKKNDSKVMVGEKEYSYNKIIEALGNTGIFSIESWLEKAIKESE